MKKFILFIFICALFGYSCSVTEPIFISNSNMEFKGVNNSDFIFTVDANVYNPSAFKYQLKELSFDITYDKEKVGSGKLTAPQQINVKDTIALPFFCNLDLSQLQKKHEQILSQDTSNFIFVGEAFAVHPLKKIRKGFEMKIPYNVKSLIADNILSHDLVLSQIEVGEINPFTWSNPIKSSFRLKVQIYNKQPFDFKIKHIELSLKSKQTEKAVLHGILDTIIDAPSHKTVKIPLNVESNNLNLLQDLGNFFWGENKTKYLGSGFIVINIKGYDFQIPFAKEFDALLNSFGSTGTPIRNNSNNGFSYLENISRTFQLISNHTIKPTNSY